MELPSKTVEFIYLKLKICYDFKKSSLHSLLDKDFPTEEV